MTAVRGFPEAARVAAENRPFAEVPETPGRQGIWHAPLASAAGASSALAGARSGVGHRSPTAREEHAGQTQLAPRGG